MRRIPWFGPDLLFLKAGHRRQYFFHLFLSILAVASLILIPATLISTSMFSNILAHEIQNGSIAVPRLMVGAFSSWHYSFMPYSTTLIQDSRVSRLMYAKDLTALEKVQGLDALNLMHVSNPLVHSVYIYNYQSDRVFSTLRGEESPDECSDPNLLHLVGYGTKARVYAYLPRTLLLTGSGTSDRGENVLSVIVGYPGITTGSLKGGMVVNLSEKRLRELLSSSGKQSGNEFYLLDRTGRFISHPDPEKFGTVAHADDPAYIAARQGTAEGSLIAEIGSRRKVLTYATQPELGWLFVHAADYEGITRQLAILRNRSLLIFMALLLTATILSLWRSRGLYRPIEHLVRGASELRSETVTRASTGSEQDTELQFLGESIALARENLRALRNGQVLVTLTDVLTGKRDVSELQSLGGLPSLETLERGYRVILLRLNGVAAFRSTKGSRALLDRVHELRGLAKNFMDKRSLVLETGDDRIAVIRPDAGDAPQDHAAIESLMAAAAQSGNTITAGISSAFHAPEDLPVAYDQAYRATREQFRSDGGKIFRAQRMPCGLAPSNTKYSATSWWWGLTPSRECRIWSMRLPLALRRKRALRMEEW